MAGLDLSGPVVSVVMTAFEHERFIGAALESVIQQELDVPMEVLVGVDLSRDTTSEVVRHFEREHPGRVRGFHRSSRLGLFGNFEATVAAARGRFIALLEGDDFWTDRRKLATQLERLESRPRTVVSGHLVERIELEGRKLGTVPEAPYSECPERSEWIRRLCDFHTSSLLFRNVFGSSLPPAVLDVRARVFDLPLKLALAARGEVDFVARPMSVFRRVPGSASAGFDDEEWRDIILHALKGSRREMPTDLRRVVDRETAELMAGGALSKERPWFQRGRLALGALIRNPRVGGEVLARGVYSGLPESAKRFYRGSRGLLRDTSNGAAR